MGADAEMVKVPCAPSDHMWMMNADGTRWAARKKGTPDAAVDDAVPSSQFFSEGNGGEFRKSYHGYPAGTAQLVARPQTFVSSPMQIDTWNRDTPLAGGAFFVPGPEPRESQAPVGAAYSGLLECPCTDRLYKVVELAYTTWLGPSGDGRCDAVRNASECAAAVASLVGSSGGESGANATEVDDPSRPAGCSFDEVTAVFTGRSPPPSSLPPLTPSATASTTAVPKSYQAYFNTLAPGEGAGCDAATAATRTAATATGADPASYPVAGEASDIGALGVAAAVRLDPATNAAELTLSGPADVWFGVAWGARQMADLPYATIVSQDYAYSSLLSSSSPSAPLVGVPVTEDGWALTERQLGDHDPGSLLEPSVTVLSHSLDEASNTRTVVLSRPMDLSGWAEGYYSYDPTGADGTINILAAVGDSPEFAYHKAHGNGALSLLAAGATTCACRGLVQGSICGNAVGVGTAVGTPASMLQPGSKVGNTAGSKAGSIGVGDGDNCIAFPVDGEQQGAASTFCPPQPTSDLAAFGNRVCDVDSYNGGLRCCHHLNTLLDTDQPDPWPDFALNYSLKFRFWFQDYVPPAVSSSAASPASSSSSSMAVNNATAQGLPAAGSSSVASHENLLRLYWQTESFAGEYDVPPGASDASPGTSWVDDGGGGAAEGGSGHFEYTISSTFSVRDMVYECDPALDQGGCAFGFEGLELAYAGGHCHAPSCISIELVNLDDGATLCRQTPVWGAGEVLRDPFDELGYATLPPCLWGKAGDGDADDAALPPRPFLPFNATLRTVCRQNSTVGHYGQMASWQMRGLLANAPTGNK